MIEEKEDRDSESEVDAEREHKVKPSEQFGESWLIYGCQHPDADDIYAEDFRSFVRLGTLDHLYPAYSRRSEEKHYVQHVVVEHGERIANLLDRGAVIYVCG